MSDTPQRGVRYSPDSSNGTFRISGSSARLAGSTDLARTYPHPGEKNLVETSGNPSVYSFLPNPTLLIYPLAPKFDVKSSGVGSHAELLAEADTKTAQSAWTEAINAGVKSLMALKIAIPGEPGARNGDVDYLLNGPAIEEFVQDFALSAEDVEDIDE